MILMILLGSCLIQNISQTSEDFSLKGVGHAKASHIAHKKVIEQFLISGFPVKVCTNSCYKQHCIIY